MKAQAANYPDLFHQRKHLYASDPDYATAHQLFKSQRTSMTRSNY